MSDSSRSPEAGIAEALAQISEETRALVRTEIERARDETVRRARAATPAAALLGAGALFGLASVASAYRLVLRILERMSTPSVGAFLAMAGFGAGAVVCLGKGRGRLAEAPAPLPVDTARDAAATVRDTANAAAEETRQAG